MRHHDARSRSWPARQTRRVLIALLALSVGGVAFVPAAGADVAPRDRVYASYLPTVGQASRVYPFLSEGERYVGRYKGLGAAFSCWDWTSAFKAADGRWSSYGLKGGAMPYFKGLEDPAVFVFKFHNRAKAQSAFAVQQRFVRKCMGRQSEDGTTAHLWRQPVPGIRQGSISYRSVERVEVGQGHRRTRDLHVSVLRGRYLVNIYNQAKAFQPKTENGVRLTLMTLRNIG